jgi:hypothetical protein
MDNEEFQDLTAGQKAIVCLREFSMRAGMLAETVRNAESEAARVEERAARHRRAEEELTKIAAALGCGHSGDVSECWLANMHESVENLVTERDQAVLKFERIKSVAQALLGEKPGETIVSLIADLQRQLDDAMAELKDLWEERKS